MLRPGELRDADRPTLLIYAPVPLYEQDGTYFVEKQACNGLRLWAEHFNKVIVMSPLAKGSVPTGWEPAAAIGEALCRIEIVALPMAYRPDKFFRAVGSVRPRIRALIERADYLSFSIGGLFGDWGSVACWEAHRLGRPYAVWTDRVESEVVRRTVNEGSWRQRLRSRLYHRPMAWLERFLIRRAALGLFHGRETFDFYAPYCTNPQIVHDIHIGKADHIAPEALAAKIRDCAEGPLRICYIGRMAAMKAPFDWLEVLERLDAAGIDFRATWLGDGPDYEAFTARVAELGLADRVEAPGFVSDHPRILAALRESHLLMFCHRTPESPRNLIEALISGCPIVGYDSPYSRDLVSENKGGILTPLDDVTALTEVVSDLAHDRSKLADLIARAAKDGEPYDDESVFRHRSDIIKKYL